jgi:hypothetical protein
MAKKIGHNYERDPYPWDVAKNSKMPEEWTCCDMKLPATFYICPICEKEREFPEDSESTDELDL